MADAVPLPGLEALSPNDGPPPAERGARAIEAYVRAQAAAENRAAGTRPRPGGRAVSRDQILTRVRAALLEAGYHPLTRLPLHVDPDATCGDCAHAVHRGRWTKCARHRDTSCRETDVVRRWPACQLWEAIADV